MDNNEENKKIIYCSRCGAEMKSTSRYCMKCGNMNYNHQENESFRKFIPNEKKETYEVGSGKFISNRSSNQMDVSLANNTGNKTMCFIVNFSLFLLLFCSLLFISFDGVYSLDSLLNSFFPVFSIILSIAFMYIYSLELIYMKCNKRWWASLIPIYNVLILSEIVFNKKIYGFLTFIPVIGPLFMIVMFYKLGEKFKYNGLIVVLLFVLFVPIMGFGTRTYMGYNFVDYKDKESLEKDYKLKRLFLFFTLLVFCIGMGLYLYSNMTTVKSTSNRITNYYYIYTTNKVIKKLKNKIDEGKFSCGEVNYSSSEGIYYFNLSDPDQYVFLPFYILRDPISMYVKVDNTSGTSNYYVSMTDGTFGYPETIYDEITVDTVTNYTDIDSSMPKENLCYIK